MGLRMSARDYLPPSGAYDAKERKVRESVMHPPVRFRIIPTRLGRRSDVEPFEIVLNEHRRPTAHLLAEKLHREVKPYLLSSDFDVTVNLKKMQFQVAYGRFGGGYIEEVPDDADVHVP